MADPKPVTVGELYAIINERWQDERSVVVTTNLEDREQLRQQLGERTVSRLSEMCAAIPIFGADRRKPFVDWSQRSDDAVGMRAVSGE